jgi:hypothetical protein
MPDEWIAARGARSPLLVGVLTLLSGFGVMTLLYTVWGRFDYPSLRGLFGFGSATIGDALLLPVAAALAAAFHRECDSLSASPGMPWIARAWGSRGNALLGSAGLLSALVMTGALYAAWLIPADTELNWTIPAPHTMNFYGFWHMAFFAVMFVWFGVFYVRVIRLLAALRSRAGSERIPQVARAWALCNGVFVLQLAFSVLLVYDYRQQVLSTSSGWTWLIGAVVGLLAYAWVTRSFWAAVVPSVGNEWRRVSDADVAPERRWVATVVGTAAVGAAVVAVASASFGYTLTPDVAWPLLLAFALVLLAVWNCIQAIYTIQRRAMTSLGLVVAGCSALVLGAGYMGGLARALAALPLELTKLVQLGPYAGTAVIAAVVVTFVVLVLFRVLLSVEANLPGVGGAHGVLTRLNEPSGEIEQNVAQFAMMQVLIVMPCALVAVGLPPEMVKEPMQLFYGYAALVGVAVTFPLSNNMAYVRDIKSWALARAENGDPDAIDQALVRANYYTQITMSVAGITVMALAAALLQIIGAGE